MNPRTPRVAGLVLFAVLAVWAWQSPLLLPLKLVVVLFHESGHALATVLTGGTVRGFTVGADESGAVLSEGGWPILTLNAGYLGSVAWGLALVAVTRRAGPARATAAGLAAFLAFVALGWTRPVVSFAFAWVLLVAAGFAALARFARDGVVATVLRGLGVVSLLYALGDIVDDVLLRPGAPSDAMLLAARTGVPAFVWGVAWMVAALALLRAVLPRVA